MVGDPRGAGRNHTRRSNRCFSPGAERQVGLDDGAERQVERAKPVGIDVDLVLLDMAADRGDLGDAWDGVELVPDEPVLETPQVAQRLAIALDGVPEHLAHARRVRPERRHRALGHPRRHEAEPLEHARASEVQIHVVFEDDVDPREAEGRLRADDPDAGEAAQVDRQRVADLVLDFLRAVPGPVGEHDHLVVREIGDRVDWRGRGGPPPPSAKRHREADDEGAVPQREFDNPVDHGPGWEQRDFLRKRREMCDALRQSPRLS